MIRKYQKRPVNVLATVYDGSEKSVLEILKLKPDCTLIKTEKGLTIPTLEGDHNASKGDYIIQGVNGEIYPCKPDIFEKTYIEIKEA